ncbi:hypothetical protein TRIP_C20091 [Candidatus Zixiibacteriota bacterium]|nr:hypothetical protein TRIP_C20091 [candidate division Zixibacteria bacterium]
MNYLSEVFYSAKLLRVIVVSGLIVLSPCGVIFGGGSARHVGTQMRLETISNERLTEKGLPENHLVSPGLTQWMEITFPSGSESEGMCQGVLHDAHNNVLWSGQLGCTVCLSTKPGFFFAYNPEGFGEVRIYNTNISELPIAQPEAYPTEHSFSPDGNYLLLGGGQLMLFDSSGKLYFSKKQRLDMDVNLAVTSSAEHIAIADLLEGSALVSSSLTAPEASPEASQFRDQMRSKIKHKRMPIGSESPSDSGQQSRADSAPGNKPPQYKGITSWPQYVTILNQDGVTESEFEIPYFANQICISDIAGKYVAIANANQLCVFLQDGSKQWDYSLENPMNYIGALAVDDDGIVAAVVNESRLSENPARNLVIWDSAGRMMSSQPLVDRKAIGGSAIQLKVAGDIITGADEVSDFSFKIIR